VNRIVVAVGAVPPPPSGSAAVFARAMVALRGAGFDVRHIDISEARGTSVPLRVLELAAALVRLVGVLRRDSVYAIYWNLGGSRSAGLRDLLFIAVTRALGKVNHRVAHIHNGKFYECGRGAGLPYVVRLALRQATAVICLDSEMEMQVRDLVSPETVTGVIANPAPQGRGRAIDEEDDAPLRLCFFSTVRKDKGVLRVVEAAEALSRDGTRVRLEIAGPVVGSAGWEDELRQRIRQAGFDPDQVLIGPIQGPEVRHFLARQHVMALPTTYLNEAQPISVVEALAAGCVPVVPAYRGLPSLVSATGAGVIVPTTADIARWAAAVLEARQMRRELVWDDVLQRLRHLHSEEEFDRRLGAFLAEVGGIETGTTA
jgi:glycosyltransferase involved in cell wall biosynthesis